MQIDYCYFYFPSVSVSIQSAKWEMRRRKRGKFPQLYVYAPDQSVKNCCYDIYSQQLMLILCVNFMLWAGAPVMDCRRILVSLCNGLLLNWKLLNKKGPTRFKLTVKYRNKVISAEMSRKILRMKFPQHEITPKF